MFRVLHRVYVLTWVAVLLGGAAWAYARSGVPDGLSDWYAVWQNRPRSGIRSATELSGTVLKVVDGTSLTLRGADRQVYSVGLQGLVAPAPATPKVREATNSLPKRLRELVLSNDVQVVVSWMDESRRAMGVVRLGATNVNAWIIESGLAKLNRDFIKSLPMLEQYALIRADRRSNARKPAAADADVTPRSP